MATPDAGRDETSAAPAVMRHHRALLATLAAAALAASARPAAAQACPTTTLADYLGGVVGPCTIDAVTFSGFNGTYAFGGLLGPSGGPATAAEILVTPTSGTMGGMSYVGFLLTNPAAPILQLAGAGGTALSSSSSLQFGATAALPAGGVFEQLFLASGTVEASGSGLVPGGLASASITVQDLVGGGSVTIAAGVPIFGGSESAFCDVTFCDAGFDGGAFQLASQASASVLVGAGNGSASASVSDYEARFTYGFRAVPEPATVGLVAFGLAVAAPLARRRQKRASR